MNRTFSQRVGRFHPSPTLAASAAARKLQEAGIDITDWCAGEPDFATPEPICEAARAAIAAGETRYTPVGGTPRLIQAILNKFRNENGLEYHPEQVLASAGVKHCLYNCLQALIDNDAEVIIPAPYWASYPDMVRLAGGVPVHLPLHPARGFRFDPEDLARALTPNTRLLLLNSPSNPCGTMFRKEDLEAVATILRAHPQVCIASDDIYEHIRFDGRTFYNLAQVAPDLHDRTLVFNGVSKAYAMTGWRLGYVAGPADIVGTMRNIQSQSTSNPCSISQAAACAALESEHAPIDKMVEAFRERRDYIVGALDDLPGVSCQSPDGAFYCFPEVRGMMERLGCDSDIELAVLLLEKLHLSVVAGTPFGAPDHIRVSFATDMETLQQGIRHLQKLLG